MITNIISYNKTPHTVVPFFWFLYIDKHNVKLGRATGIRKQLRNYNHKGNPKNGCYSKSLLIFTTYQVQEWWTMIISPQQEGSNFRKNLLNISWHTHLRHSNPYTFILQKVKKHPDGFVTHIFCLSNQPNIWWFIFT